jgi:hypothetical protein
MTATRRGYAPPMETRRLDRALVMLPVLLVAGCRHGGGQAVDSADECPGSWLEAPAVDPSIVVPSAGARVLFHAAAAGSQIYHCAPPADDPSGPLAWSAVGPEATLVGCKGAVVGRHFQNDATRLPEWQLTDGPYVVAHKEASWPRSDAIAWLLLAAQSTLPNDAGAVASAAAAHGAFSETRYVQRVHTTGGLPPTDTCNRGNLLEIRKVPYTADYYFYGP